MSDENQWQPPTSTGQQQPGSQQFTAPPAAPFAAPGGPAAPSAGSDASGGGQQPPPSSWTLPPKPGLIPLRPLTLGDILGASFKVLRRNPRPTFGFAVAMQGIVAVLTVVVVGLVGFASFSRLATASAEDSADIMVGAFAVTMLSSLLPIALSLVLVALVQGILMLEVQRAALGEKQTLRQLWHRARGRLGALAGWMLLVAVAVIIAFATIVGVIVLFSTLLGVVGIAIAVLVGIFGGLGLVVIGAWLGTKLSLVPSVLMGERLTLRAAVARSWSLTGGYFWRTFGIQLLVAVILGFVTQVVTAPVQFLAPMVVFLVDPNGTGGPVAVIVLIAGYLLSLLVVIVVSSLTLVVQSACTALIYIDLRMRKEGLDLELSRFVEETHAGATNVADPFLVAGHARVATGNRADALAAQSAPQPLPPSSASPWT